MHGAVGRGTEVSCWFSYPSLQHALCGLSDWVTVSSTELNGEELLWELCSPCSIVCVSRQ